MTWRDVRRGFCLLSIVAVIAAAAPGPVINNPTISGGTIANTPISGSTGALTRLSPTADGSTLQIGAGSSADGRANNWLWGYMRITGTVTGADPTADSQGGANKVLVNDQATLGSPTYGAMVVEMFTGSANIVAAGNTATRQAVNSRIVAQGQIGPSPTIGPAISNAAFISSLSTGYATATQGGLGGWSSGLNPILGYFRGSMFGGNDNVWLTTGAANYLYLIGREIDVSIQGTSNVYGRYGLLIASFASTKPADGSEDAAIGVYSADNTANNFKDGIAFGTATQYGAFSNALIRASARTQPAGLAGPVTAPRGIDFSAAVFSDAFLRGPSNTFVVDGSGNVTGASYKAGAAAGVSCAAGALVPATAVVTGGIITHC